MRLAMIAAVFAFVAQPGLAAGGDSFTPPPVTPTSTTCPDGKIWDEKTEACTDARDSRFNDEQRLNAARELAYADRPDAALRVLATISDQQADMVLTYMGFAHRKAGRWDTGMSLYQAAIRQNPDNILARSYMGQGLAERGDMQGARAQLREITARGGRETWAAFALRGAVRSGKGVSY
jgi:tetratricopeptide (TPR) repeat protein